MSTVTPQAIAKGIAWHRVLVAAGHEVDALQAEVDRLRTSLQNWRGFEGLAERQALLAQVLVDLNAATEVRTEVQALYMAEVAR